ncbi:MAG: CHAT domain-containing protein [Paludibacteraceae bacterium]|nr:CHAT domain-containing protein [Paludibacteraceae bacterium]
MEYLYAMSKTGEHYADTANADYSKKKAMQYFVPAAEKALSLEKGSLRCADVLMPYLQFLLSTRKEKYALEYADALYLIFDNAARERFGGFSREQILVWLKQHRRYSDVLFAILDRSNLSREQEDMLYNMCLIEKCAFSASKYDEAVSQVRFEDVKKVLAQNDVAVEFASYEYNGKCYYTSSLLRSGWNHPRKYSICVQNDTLTSLVANKVMISKIDEMYYMIWGNLASEFRKTDRIWFSPAGDFHLLGIEYCKIPQSINTYISDQYQMHRVFSTARLITMRFRSNTRTPVKLASLYGNVFYGEGRWRDLQNTVHEINNVSRVLTDAGYYVSKFTRKEADKKSFLAMSGKKIGIIHIATHGFSFRITDDDSPFGASGILLANGNCAFSGDSVYFTKCDGVLLANEVDTMHLPDTRLVVLSACRSGFGTVIADNVVGMQSALRYAGAEAVMTSLWDVNDEATSLLMSTFYHEYLTTRKSLQESLRTAQAEIRRHTFAHQNIMFEGREPKFWAGFIIYE